MKRILVLIGLSFGLLSLQAQTQMKDVFRTMPDSLLLLLKPNDRMDLLDFKENGMHAQVSNRLDSKSTLDSLTADYLYLTVTKNSFMEMKLVTLQDQQSGVLVAYSVAGPALDTHLSLYTLDWKPVALEDYVTIPQEKAYWIKSAEEMTDQERTALRYLDPVLTEIRLSPTSQELTFTLSTLVLSREDRKIADALLRPVKVPFLQK